MPTCKMCKTKLPGKSYTRGPKFRYCSGACRQKAYRQRKIRNAQQQQKKTEKALRNSANSIKSFIHTSIEWFTPLEYISAVNAVLGEIELEPASCDSGIVKYQHEQAYVLAKGRPEQPRQPIADVLAWEYSGNKLHPTQKPLGILKPLIQTFSEQGSVVLDPFAGSGSCCLASKSLFRDYIGIELDKKYAAIAQRRLEAVYTASFWVFSCQSVNGIIKS